MVSHDQKGYAWRCADCGYVYGTGTGAMSTPAAVSPHIAAVFGIN
jgi:hypothetical protein